MFSRKKIQDYGPLVINQSLRNHLQQSNIFDKILGGNDTHITGVCGCHSAAGASSVALGLAIMLQERTNESVLLVEANLRSPVLRKAFNLSVSNGFEDFAKKEAEPDEYIIKLPGTEISAIVATPSETPLPLITLAKSQLSSVLSSKFKHIIIDFPPVLSYPDTGIMAAATDGVLLVLEAEGTRWQVAKETKKRLESAGVKLLGAALNKKPHYIPNWLYRLL